MSSPWKMQVTLLALLAREPKETQEKDAYLFRSPSGEAIFSDRAGWEFRRSGRAVMYWCGAPCVIRNGISRRAPNKAMYWPPVHPSL